MLRVRAVVLAAALILAPLGARAADLVVWWEKGFYPQEDEAVREIIAAFEQETGKQVELVLHAAGRAPDKLQAAIEAGRPPDFAVRHRIADDYIARMGVRRSAGRSHRTRSGPSRTCSIRTRSPGSRCATRRPGKRRSTRCRWAATTNHVHVWKSLLKQAGFTLADIPQGVGGVLVVLVRPGAAGRAQGAGPRRHLGRRPAHVGQARRYRRPVRPVRGTPTRRTT